jgi:predicted O-linked N-acetylglucosamine transferase (SPINDLY family)
MEIFSYRVAPVQVLYLGWPGTSGAAFYDYVLADPVVLPRENFQYFSENPVWLPHCYQPNDNHRKVASDAPSRSECGLGEAAFVFCCFNNPFKVLPEMFDIWMSLLRQVPGSVLWLLQSDPIGQENLLKEADRRGVDGSRLIFAPRLPNDKHLARLAHADLVLDTLPYNAHTTASDALWQGVPVITCTGRSFAGRVATSLLHNVGLPELATASLAEYEALALRLASDPAAAKAIREKLDAGRSSAALFATERLARGIEKAYREMIRRVDQGLPPSFLDVRELCA